jgi:hypothetical protein
MSQLLRGRRVVDDTLNFYSKLFRRKNVGKLALVEDMFLKGMALSNSSRNGRSGHLSTCLTLAPLQRTALFFQSLSDESPHGRFHEPVHHGFQESTHDNRVTEET